MNLKLAAGALALSTLAPSCLGPNNAFNGLQNWNAGVTDIDALAEVLYLGMWIIPVYPIVLAADGLVFNTIDYWSGKNPISDPEPWDRNAFNHKATD